MTPERTILLRTRRRLLARLEHLEGQLDGTGSGEVWREFRETAIALAALGQAAQPGAGGALLTTAELAAQLGITPKTLLRRKARGSVRPAVQAGKLIRWKTGEVPR